MKMFVWKVENSNIIKCKKEDFIKSIDNGKFTWEHLRKELDKNSDVKRYILREYGNTCYYFTNNLTQKEIDQIHYNTITNVDGKTFILYHKNISTLEFTVDSIKGLKFTNCKILNEDHMPPFLKPNLDIVSEELISWLDSRLIPVNRDKYDRLKQMNKDLQSLESRIKIILNNKALTLIDCYWVNEINNKLKWQDVNYYKNNFNGNLINILIDSPGLGKQLENLKHHPGYALGGHLPKTWSLINNKRILLKAGFNSKFGENFIELKMSEILDKIGFRHIKYSSYLHKNLELSACECYNTEEKEQIDAYSYYVDKYGEGEQIYLKLYEDLPEHIQKQLNEMILTDYIFFNQDRHWSNFSLIRNPDTLEILELMPIYDNGKCLYENSENTLGKEIESKLIYDDSKELIKYCPKISKELYDKIKDAIYLIDYSDKLRQLCLDRLNNLEIC